MPLLCVVIALMQDDKALRHTVSFGRFGQPSLMSMPMRSSTVAAGRSSLSSSKCTSTGLIGTPVAAYIANPHALLIRDSTHAGVIRSGDSQALKRAGQNKDGG